MSNIFYGCLVASVIGFAAMVLLAVEKKSTIDPPSIAPKTGDISITPAGCRIYPEP